jgi:ribosomal protein L17
VKSETNEFERSERGRDFEITQRVRLGGNLRKYRRGAGSIEKAWDRAAELTVSSGESGDSARLKKTDLSGKQQQKLDLLMKAVPKKIQLQEGRHKGKVVDVVRESKNSSDNAKGFRIKAQTGSSPVRNAHGDPIATGNAMWLKERKHKVLGRGIKPDKMSPPTNPWPTKKTTPTPTPTPTPSEYSDDYDSGRFENTLRGKLTSKHAHPHIPHSKAQLALMHGVDLSKVQQQQEGWTGDNALSGFGKNAKGKNVVVKGHMEPDIFDIGSHYNHSENGGISSAQREAMYHNMAHNVFGLGQYVPTTAVAKHGDSHYSVMEKIPNAGHYEGSASHKRIMDKAKKSGDIQKLAIMNVILGNSDRHGGNYMISPKGLHMIDHGLTFNYGNNGRSIYEQPAYIKHAYPNKDNVDIPLHPEVKKWLKNINLKQVEKYLNTHKIDKATKNHILGALQAAQNGVGYKKLGHLIDGIMEHHGGSQIE